MSIIKIDQSKLAATNAASIQAQIDALEREVILPRVTREFMLANMEAVAASQGVTPEQLRASHYGYRRVKEFDEQIEALRGQL